MGALARHLHATVEAGLSATGRVLWAEILPLVGSKGLEAVLLPTRIKLDISKITPDSATRDFWSDRGSAKPDDSAIAAAIECLRSQSRS